MALGTTPLAEEDPLPRKLLLGGLARIEPPERIKLGGRRKVDDVLHLRHHRDVIDPVGSIHAFALRADMVAIEVGRALLELREVLNRSQGPLRSMDLLIEHAAQAGGVEPEARGLRANIRGQVEGSIGVEIGMAIEAGHAQALVSALAVPGLVELLLRKGREQKAKPLDLDRGENANHQLVIVLDRQQLASGHIAQFRMGGEEQGRREFGGEAIREVKIDIEAPQVAGFLPANLVNLVVRENLATGGLFDVRQWHEAGWQEPPSGGFRRGSWRPNYPR